MAGQCPRLAESLLRDGRFSGRVSAAASAVLLQSCVHVVNDVVGLGRYNFAMRITNRPVVKLAPKKLCSLYAHRMCGGKISSAATRARHAPA